MNAETETKPKAKKQKAIKTPPPKAPERPELTEHQRKRQHLARHDQ